jgi:hypothetical protein
VTFLELQNRTMGRLNWTSTESRALVKNFLNERYRQVVSSVNMARVRRGVVTANTAIGTNTITFTGVAKPLSVYDAVTLKRPLEEVAVDDIRARDAAAEVSGSPTHYAVLQHNLSSVQLLLFPKPSAVAALSMDALLDGTDMSADGDEPAFPEDFHDALIYAACIDGYEKIDKFPLAAKQEQKFKERLADLRYFIVKSAYLHQVPVDRGTRVRSRHAWPYPIG